MLGSLSVAVSGSQQDEMEGTRGNTAEDQGAESTSGLDIGSGETGV